MHGERGDRAHGRVLIGGGVVVGVTAEGSTAAPAADRVDGTTRHLPEPFVELPRVQYVRQLGLRVRVDRVVPSRVVQLCEIDASARPRPASPDAVGEVVHRRGDVDDPGLDPRDGRGGDELGEELVDQEEVAEVVHGEVRLASLGRELERAEDDRGAVEDAVQGQRLASEGSREGADAVLGREVAQHDGGVARGFGGAGIGVVVVRGAGRRRRLMRRRRGVVHSIDRRRRARARGRGRAVPPELLGESRSPRHAPRRDDHVRPDAHQRPRHLPSQRARRPRQHVTSPAEVQPAGHVRRGRRAVEGPARGVAQRVVAAAEATPSERLAEDRAARHRDLARHAVRRRALATGSSAPSSFYIKLPGPVVTCG